MSTPIKILIADDEPSIVQFLEIGLQNEGYMTCRATDGIEALQAIQRFRPQLVILDIMMPGIDGFAVCESIKATGQHISIIMLTARDEIEDRVKGLTLGADDYMIKPFSFSELLARITARLRNQHPHLISQIDIGPFRIDSLRKEFFYENQLLDLSPTEYKLLEYLVTNHGIVLSKVAILSNVWGYQFGGDYNIVEVYIRALREKLADTEHKRIRTLRGAGYRLDL